MGEKALLNKIDNIKKMLNKDLETKSLDNEQILQISCQLDELIVAYYKQESRFIKEDDIRYKI